MPSTRLLELGPTPAHNLSLTDELCVKFTSVEREVDVKIYAIEGTLGGVHSLEIRFEVFPREVGCESDDFFDACRLYCISHDR